MSENNLENIVQIEIPELEPAAVVVPLATPKQDSLEKRNSDEKSAAEYALHILFTQFVRYSERKLSDFDNYSEDARVPLENILGEGVDPDFDKIISSLGHVACRKPKPVIDSVMYWRRSKADLDANARQSRSTDQAILERKSIVSIYIMSRVLMEVVRQTPAEVLGDELCEKLESIVFKQIVNADPQNIAYNPIRRSNWLIFAQLLGEMSRFRFASVGDRFISELEVVPKSPDRQQEAHVELLIRAMKHLEITLYPEENLEESANFLESIAKFYHATSSIVLKEAYCDTLCSLFDKIAESATVEVNHPVWASTIANIYREATENMKKSWDSAFDLAAMALCVAPKELYADHWMQLLDSQLSKNKGKWSTRSAKVYASAARSLWVLVFRCKESFNETTRKIMAVKKMLFTLNKKTWPLLNEYTINSSIFVLRASFQGYAQKTLDEIMFPLLVGNDATHMNAHPSVSLDSLVSERALIAVKAYMLIMQDLTSEERQPFPTSTLLHSSSSPCYRERDAVG